MDEVLFGDLVSLVVVEFGRTTHRPVTCDDRLRGEPSKLVCTVQFCRECGDARVRPMP